MVKTMNYRLPVTLLLLTGLYACEQSGDSAQNTTIEPLPVAEKPSLQSGIDMSDFNTELRPQDDFYQYVNGTWLSENDIPADKANLGSFNLVGDET